MKNKRNKLNKRELESMDKDELISFLFDLNSVVEKQDTKINNQETKIKLLESDNEVLLEMLRKMKFHKFGKKSEKSDALHEQLSFLFDEVEVTSSVDEIVEEEKSSLPTEKKKRVGRKKLTESNPDLKVEKIVHEMDELLKQGYKVIGQKEIEKLIFVPAKLYIERHIYPTYQKELDSGYDDIQSLYKGNEFISKSNATPRLVASIITDKYAKALPLYRIEESFKNKGANISRQTMSNWVMSASKEYLTSLYNVMKTDLLGKDIIHADETTVQVLNHQDGSSQKTSYMWLYRTGEHDDNIIIYDYQPGRGQAYAEAFLENFEGYLHTDGYQAYKNIENVIQVGCLAHGRRKFTEALQSQDKRSESAKIALVILRTMNKIFTEDQKLKAMSLEEKQLKRESIIQPLFDTLHTQLLEGSEKTLPNSVIGKAIQYNLNQFESFKNVLKDSRLELSNNRAERAIKPFVIGRKNWLFSNTTNGAQESSILYSIIQSAKDNGLNVESYLTYVFDVMSKENQFEEQLIQSLLPHSKQLPKELYSKKNH